MLTRRQTLALLPATLALPALAQTPALTRPTLGEDGLHHFAWYLESFLDIPEDIAAAKAAGKRLVVMWGLKGCPACKRMHEVHLMDPAAQAYIRQHFEVLHLNILGSREVTGLGGRKLPEKAFAESEGVRSTPTLQFMPEAADGKAEVARLDRLPDVPAFAAMFRYVRENGYEREGFEAWRARSG
ncbi:MAG: thioredoxin family protein [Beijerinckiaceae bacterium]